METPKPQDCRAVKGRLAKLKEINAGRQEGGWDPVVDGVVGEEVAQAPDDAITRNLDGAVGPVVVAEACEGLGDGGEEEGLAEPQRPRPM